MNWLDWYIYIGFLILRCASHVLAWIFMIDWFHLLSSWCCGCARYKINPSRNELGQGGRCSILCFGLLLDSLSQTLAVRGINLSVLPQSAIWGFNIFERHWLFCNGLYCLSIWSYMWVSHMTYTLNCVPRLRNLKGGTCVR